MEQNQEKHETISTISSFSQKIVYIEKLVTTVLFFFMLMLIFAQVVSRFFVKYPLVWSEELIRYVFIVCTYLGSAIAIQQSSHIEIDLWPLILSKISNDKIKTTLIIAVPIIADLIGLLFIGFYCWLLFGLVHKSFLYGQASPSLGIPMGILSGCVLISATLMVFHYLVNIIEKLRQKIHFFE